MAQTQIEQFFAKAHEDPALFARVMDGTEGPEDFIKNMVNEAKAVGLEFSYEEADSWIKEQQRVQAGGELSEAQLEAVAGGNALSFAQSAWNTYNKATNSPGAIANTTWNGGKAAFNGIVSAGSTALDYGVNKPVSAATKWISSW